MALSFGTVGDQVDDGTPTFTNSVAQLSGSCWIKPAQVATRLDVLGRTNAGTTVGFYFTTGKNAASKLNWTLADAVGQNQGDSPASLVAGWQHVGFVFDSTQATNALRLKLYINGVPVAVTFTIGGNGLNQSLIASADHLLLGRSGAGVPFVGLIAHVKLWSTAIADSDMLRDSQSYLPLTGGLGLWQPLDDGRVATDYAKLLASVIVTGTTQYGNAPVGYGKHVWQS